MAYTVTKYPTIFGNKKVVGLRISTDAATQTIETGLTNIEFASVAIISATSANFKFAYNSNASGVAAMGSVALTGMASTDELFVTVYGR